MEKTRNTNNKSKNNNMAKSQKGITLVALVITIIILIILATVAINFAFGNNGLITQAEKARDMAANSTVQEETAMNSMVDELANVMAEPPVPTPPTDGSFSEEEGVNTPNIGANMQLVVFDDSTNTWIEDTTKEAYNYKDTSTQGANSSEWANAKVTIDGIDSYFVWIPRYAYKITYYTDDTKETISNTPTTYGTIDIKFLQDTGTLAADGETICKYADDETLDTTTDYIIHPAFTTNADLGGGWENELTGIWIGKYETASDYIDGERILKVQPGMQSYTNGITTIGDIYTYALAYASNLESHMLKNSEWGAVAYLTESKYGRNGTEIELNEASRLTGGGTENAYVKNTLQSSTGNVYGIYDLRGSCREFVASYYSGGSTLNNGSSFTNTKTSDRYSTVYSGTSASTSYKYGDATYETRGWHSDMSVFVNSAHPFFARGGYNYGTASDTGIFYYNRVYGAPAGEGFRLALVV